MRRPTNQGEPEDWAVDRGLPLGLRLLALVGALSFVMIGLSVVVPLLRPAPPGTPMPDQRDGRIT